MPQAGAYERTMLYETNKTIKQILQWMGKTIKKKEEKKKIKRKKKIERKEKLEIQKLPEKTNRFHQTRREKDTKMEWSSN